jgi:HSP20 family protein
MVKKKKKEKIDVKTKKSKKETTSVERPSSLALWNPYDVIEAMDRFFYEDPWAPMWMRRWGSLVPISRDMWPWRWMDRDTRETVMDMVDTGREYKIVAEMPGVSKEDIEVSLTPERISICGELKSEEEDKDEGYVRRERSYSTFCRNMMFPDEVNPDKAEAMLKDGILEIRVAKKKPSKGKIVPVK